MPPPTSLTTVLRAVARSPVPVSRAAVAGVTGLTKATVSAQVERLVVAGLVAEGEALPRAGAGRPGTGLTLSGERHAAVGLEIGVDYLAGVVRDLAGTVRQRVVRPRAGRGAPDDVLRDAGTLLRTLVRSAREDGLRVAGLGVAVPGLTDGGTVLLAPNLGWNDVDVAGPLAAAADLAQDVVLVDNEGTLATVAEIGHPAGRPTTGVDPAGGVLVVSGEVGIGAGAVLEGALARGRNGWFGELGHVAVDPAGARCGCGALGCLETVAGQEAILRAAGLGPAPVTALGGPAPQVSAVRELVAGAEAAEPRVLSALARAADALGLAVAGAVNLLDVDAVVLGGIYADLAPWLVPAVEDQLRQRVLRTRLRPVRVVASRTGPDAAVLGAAAVVLAALLDHPERAVRDAARLSVPHE